MSAMTCNIKDNCGVIMSHALINMANVLGQDKYCNSNSNTTAAFYG